METALPEMYAVLEIELPSLPKNTMCNPAKGRPPATLRNKRGYEMSTSMNICIAVNLLVTEVNTAWLI